MLKDFIDLIWFLLLRLSAAVVKKQQKRISL